MVFIHFINLADDQRGKGAKRSYEKQMQIPAVKI